MTSSPATTPVHAPAALPWQFVRVVDPLLPQAAERLVAAQAMPNSPDARRENGRKFLSAAGRHGIDLSRMWASLGSGDAPLVREVALAVPGTGRTAMMFTSAPGSPEAEAEVAALIDRVCSELPGIALAQALLEPNEQAAYRAFRAAGFIDVGRLAYLRRPMPRKGEFNPPAALPEGVTLTNWTRHDEPDLIRALERSYIDTLDCPELCGLRDTTDVIASHRGTGIFDHRYWWIIRHDGVAEGAMLFNPCPDQSTVELVYVGLSPVLRGKGLGRLLLETALSRLAMRSEGQITCAVDQRNTPALRLYRTFGFEMFADRLALVRPVRANCG